MREVRGALWSSVLPTSVVEGQLVAWSNDAAALLDMDAQTFVSPELVQVLSGNALLEGMQPFAANYGGHQFGHWAGQLGDGRAISLGEIVNKSGERWELQLKGAGPTPYSRKADGRAVLRSSVREFLCSEAMHHLGIPTTRALSLVNTGETVVRDMFYDGRARAETGAIVCRVAPSFIRFGNFELPAARGEVELLRTLVDFCIHRDYPQLDSSSDNRQRLYGDWFALVCERTAIMIAHWMRVGFVHGVMNTDNMSILGLTIDYGPYGWIDNFDPDWTPNTTDARGRRYRFGWQPKVAYWNLAQLARALSPVFDDAEPLHAGLQRYTDVHAAADRDNIARKLGLQDCGDADVALMDELHVLLQSSEADMTIFFRALGDIDLHAPSMDPLTEAFYDDDRRAAAEPAFVDWLERYAERGLEDLDGAGPQVRSERMRLANPRYVLRNYLAQQAIDRADAGDYAGIVELLDLLRRPYDDQPGHEAYARKRPDWARDRAGCSMLSCSS